MFPKQIIETQQNPTTVCLLAVIFALSGLLGPIEAKEPAKANILRMDDILRMAWENQVSLQTLKLQLKTTNYEWEKTNGAYAWTAEAKGTAKNTTNFNLPQYAIQGTKITDNSIQAGINKKFSTGTSLGIAIIDNRYETNAGKTQSSSGFSSFAQPSYHFATVGINISQDLLKNFFGYQDRLKLATARRSSSIQRLNTLDSLSKSLVNSLIEFWNLSLSEEVLETNSSLLGNAKLIRDIYSKKANFGFDTTGDIHQWNSIVLSATSAVKNSELERNKNRRDLLTSLGKEPEESFSFLPVLIEEQVAVTSDYEKEVLVALEKRYDVRASLLQLKNSEDNLKSADNGLLPKFSVGGTYNFKNYDQQFPQDFYGILGGRFNQNTAEFKLEYPLGNEIAEAEYTKAESEKRQAQLEWAETQNKVRADLLSKRENLTVSYELFLEAKKNREESKLFYDKALSAFRNGRGTSIVLRNAMDAYVRSQSNHSQSLITYNIAIIQYEISKGTFFEKYSLDPEQLTLLNTEENQ
ncbi:TolC family protein [Leptospira terpstrae]|uniref:Outer membrane efflux protein n=1 Tax=Leptospira terpstrae serovar Hualin str. LT 11-33 = ATCC 700639 TaxID=1257025 RepID=N1VQN3_9LEPT|nr:TolC family protein [Leptospira terpstrae]EMY60758.1 outer membrane efflux protein [Leptospira terpstrae serovar Hualin str. LT 11-33 = ATCC 700639]